MSSRAPAISPTDKLGAATKGRILIVDDDSALASVFAKALRKANYDVECAADGAKATTLLDTKAFDVIVSDISMPELSGIELLQAVRKRDPDLPVLLVTGEPHVDSAIRAVEYGALRYLKKPVPPELLKDVVGRAVQLRKLARIKREAMGLLHDRTREASVRAGLEASLTDGIRGLQMHFQPIVKCCNRTLYGYEALLRSSNTSLPNPTAVLEAAERLERVHELGRRVRDQVADAMPLVPREALVFVNLHPAELADDALYRPDAPLSRHAARVVLEVTERAHLEQVGDLNDRLGRLRALGYRIAVDDLGAGYAGLTSFVRLDPEFVKIDMTLNREVHRSPTKQRLLRSTYDACRELGVEVVGEGVETKDELRTLLDIGADLLQGYLFGKPSEDFHPVRAQAFDI